MSLFDFLAQDPNAAIDAGIPAAPQMAAPQQPAPAPMQGLLAQPEAQEPSPMPEQHHGLLHKIIEPDDSGISLADRLVAVGSVLTGDQDGGLKYLQGKQTAHQKSKDEAEKQALRDKGNRAFRAAYQNGKFDAGAYAQVMGDDLDPMAFAKLNKQIGPEGGVSGSYAYKKNPLTGDIEWGGERPMDYAEHTAVANSAETARHNGVTEGQGGARLGISQADLALARQREARLGAKPAAGGASWLPPGAKIIHLPGS